jgi:shikimate dehydrogenase
MLPAHCAVLGDPIEHSLSPALHRAGFAAAGVTFTYEAVRVRSGDLAGFLETLDDTWCGLSLTMPLKREVMGLADVVMPTAQLAGAANTLLREAGGTLIVDNTDVPGAVAAIEEKWAKPINTAVIWGGGATACSLVLAVAELGCREFTLHVRDTSRVAETLAIVEKYPEPLTVTVGHLGDKVDADLLVSTIPALPQESLIDRIQRAALVFEVIYHPWPTPLARFASTEALISGLDLLAHQAALQFEMFTGHEAPLDMMRDAGQAALSARNQGVGPEITGPEITGPEITRESIQE